jgi:hypothetical protein
MIFLIEKINYVDGGAKPAIVPDSSKFRLGIFGLRVEGHLFCFGSQEGGLVIANAAIGGWPMLGQIADCCLLSRRLRSKFCRRRGKDLPAQYSSHLTAKPLGLLPGVVACSSPPSLTQRYLFPWTATSVMFGISFILTPFFKSSFHVAAAPSHCLGSIQSCATLTDLICRG